MNQASLQSSARPTGVAAAQAGNLADHRYAGVPKRATAFSIDLVMLSTLLFTAGATVTPLLGPSVSFDADALASSGFQVDDRLESINAVVGIVGPALCNRNFRLAASP